MRRLLTWFRTERQTGGKPRQENSLTDIERAFRDIKSMSKKFDEEFREIEHRFNWQCLNTSITCIDRIELLVKQHFPEYLSSIPRIALGNISLGDDYTPCFDETLARQFALAPIRSTTTLAQYHAWIDFRGVIIDMTLLHSLRSLGLDLGLGPPQTIYAVNACSTDYGKEIRYIPYRLYTKRELMSAPGHARARN
jgi:hypothetical protein